jgi:MFS transporter, MHS family, shikimate and dehydroshikimate transport protein
MVGTWSMLLWVPVFFDLLATREPYWINVTVIVAVGLVYSCLYGPEGALFSSQFPPEVRYTGISLTVQVSGAVGGGLAPIVATWLLAQGQRKP